ncbi:MAG: deoxyribose-phosphate aldolase [Clostridia bacterium]|nr:deoxyribose-phosphate aldolase [Clostridia bacterium]
MLSSYIDHTVLKANAARADIEKLCREAELYSFASVCINPCHVKYAKSLLKDSQVKVCTVVGFPLGAMTSAAKAFEAEEAVKNGADEIDMVINIGALKDGDASFVEEDIRTVKKACKDKLLKVIIEACLLTDEEKITASICAKRAGADFVKTSTGFSTGGACIEDVRLMRKTVGNKMGVKAAGGVRTREDALLMIEAGATRIGTSAGVSIVSGE